MKQKLKENDVVVFEWYENTFLIGVITQNWGIDCVVQAADSPWASMIPTDRLIYIGAL